ncbi:Primosomal protein N' [Saezia sanguinis]|uniref:Replication restart protein PriA n=1 Tax=Saezia sanguinis TaxID=1965230 RepID=A0A433SER7_9BURK|nr:primosomal protein N' [Saezia sanguinis]RUS67134.1 Primosomal protein N' [Saezia sanguinis]
MAAFIVDVIVDLPAHSAVEGALSYACDVALAPGGLVRVPLGKKEVLGIVWNVRDSVAASTINTPSQSIELKPIIQYLDEIPPLSGAWRDLTAFSAQYYQRSLGEVALQALPPELRKLDAVQLQRRLKRLQGKQEGEVNEAPPALPELTYEQQNAVQQITPALYAAEPLAQQGKSEAASAKAAVFLLEGVTGSGKTEVYMRVVQAALAKNPQAQVLILVPEINLTPQLEARFAQRFPEEQMVSMHSGLTAAQRLRSWLLAHTGRARIVLGTRMAIFASIPQLSLIVVDEEHDPSYKQYEGARWSARDLAVWRGWHEKVPVILGSATPSLESWRHAQQGQYQLLEMPLRIGQGGMPKVRMVDMRQMPRQTVLAPALLQAMQQRIARGEQSLVLLNRRGYAPVLHCVSCGWQSQCPYCTAWRVYHRIDRTLRCHHCGFTEPVPKACPQCGDPDLQPIGRGTERLEEQLKALLQRPDGSAARVLRIDADSTRHAGSLVAHLKQVHDGDVDVLLGTQMIAKGHDFRFVTLVAAVNPDTALFSNDFRAGERLFSLLLQAAGRAGRDARLSEQSELWIQTMQPEHPLFKALKTYDFSAFARAMLEEREMAAMPPFMHQALVRAQARTQEAAQEFLNQIHQQGQEIIQSMQLADYLTLYPPIPAAMQRVAGIEHAQMLLESRSRQVLQQFLNAWRGVLHQVRVRGMVRWAIDVDPQVI